MELEGYSCLFEPPKSNKCEGLQVGVESHTWDGWWMLGGDQQSCSRTRKLTRTLKIIFVTVAHVNLCGFRIIDVVDVWQVYRRHNYRGHVTPKKFT